MLTDVAIVGGGPAGTTAGTLLKKYNPGLKVAIFEREKFPRDHIGESQLPAISQILNEMGAWDKVEAANFPIKIGATNRWGKNPELWDFEFVPGEMFRDEDRPAKFDGQRCFTAFQVDRAIYDKILLDHAREVGVEVHEETNVRKIHRSDDRIDALELECGEQVNAKYYLDASGHVGLIRRAMGVDATYPTSLQNIALWDYWQNAEWAVKIGVGGTKIQVMSLGYGWIWFIPLGPTRTSVGLVVPASYYKEHGLKPEELYLEALGQEERISALIANATREHKFTTTKDWSFLAARQSGDNWFLIGESAGFADPILSAGMTMAHCAGREAACTILEMERGKTDRKWLQEQFDHKQSQRIWSHIRFADYWYTANAQFVDIKEFIQGVAKDQGLNLCPEDAWRWLAQGGFIDEELFAGVGGFSLYAVKALGNFLSDLPQDSPLETCNVFKLNFEGATFKEGASYFEGRVLKTKSYMRGDKALPVQGRFEGIVRILQHGDSLEHVWGALQQMTKGAPPDIKEKVTVMALEGLEAMIHDGWVTATYDPNRKRAGRLAYIDKTVRLNKHTRQS